MKKNKSPSGRKNSRFGAVQVILIAVVVILAIAAVGVVGTGTFLQHHRPSVDTGVPFVTPAVTSAPPQADTGKTPSADDPPQTVTNAPEPTVPVYVRDTDSVNFLVMGRDAAAWNTDVIMIVNFNMRDYTVSVMQLPRDTYIEIDNVRGRINTAMASMRTAARKADPSLDSEALLKAGMQGAVELLEKSLCIQIDGYVHVNLDGFKNIINALGGVWVDVPCNMDYEDPYQNLYIHLKKGPQLLDGAKAEMFVRFRDGYLQADIGRMDAQKIFLSALLRQVKSNLTISTVPKIAEQMLRYVTTDIPLADIVVYAKELLGVDLENMTMMTLHGSSHQTASGAWYYVMNRASTLEMINDYFNVYDLAITDEIFDPTCAFTDEEYAPFYRIYTAAPDDPIIQVHPDAQTADDVNDGDITIILK